MASPNEHANALWKSEVDKWVRETLTRGGASKCVFFNIQTGWCAAQLKVPKYYVFSLEGDRQWITDNLVYGFPDRLGSMMFTPNNLDLKLTQCHLFLKGEDIGKVLPTAVQESLVALDVPQHMILDVRCGNPEWAVGHLDVADYKTVLLVEHIGSFSVPLPGGGRTLLVVGSDPLNDGKRLGDAIHHVVHFLVRVLPREMMEEEIRALVESHCPFSRLAGVAIQKKVGEFAKGCLFFVSHLDRASAAEYLVAQKRLVVLPGQPSIEFSLTEFDLEHKKKKAVATPPRMTYKPQALPVAPAKPPGSPSKKARPVEEMNENN